MRWAVRAFPASHRVAWCRLSLYPHTSAADKQQVGAQCQLEVSVKLWWRHDNEREQGHDSGQVTPDGVIVVLVSVTRIACACCCAESCRLCPYLAIDWSCRPP